MDDRTDKIIEEYSKTGHLDPLAMAELIQKIFENPSDENLEILQKIASKADEITPTKQVDENNFSILGEQKNEDIDEES